MPLIDGLHYETLGPADAPVVMLSSGLGGSASYWQPNMPALAARLRVVAYDHRGTGRSDRDLPDATPAAMARDVLALMDGLGIARAHLIGHAMGAAVGLELAQAAPDRLDRLVLVNGWAAADPHFLRCFDARLALLRHAGTAAFLRAQPIFLYPADWISAHHDALEAELPHQIAQFPGADTLERRVAGLAAFRLDEPRSVRCPTLVLMAADDMLVPPAAGRRLAALLPDATVATMTGGHACNVTDPATFDRLVAGFLTGD